MSNKSLDAKMLSKMFLTGAKNLEAKKEWINELNVFPVPDGDTGTNMTMTLCQQLKRLAALAKMLPWRLSVRLFLQDLFVEQEVTQVLYFHSFLEDLLRL